MTEVIALVIQNMSHGVYPPIAKERFWRKRREGCYLLGCGLWVVGCGLLVGRLRSGVSYTKREKGGMKFSYRPSISGPVAEASEGSFRSL